MTRRLTQILGGVLAVSALLGWLRAGLVEVHGAHVDTAWLYGESSIEVSDPYGPLVARLKASGFFPLSPLRQAERAEMQTGDEHEGDGSVPVFPAIVAASIADGVPQVYLRSDDGVVTAASGGETLESGWQLKMVDLNRVIAVYDGQESEFKITNYKEREGRVNPVETPNQ